jgi:hypothetical protein
MGSIAVGGGLRIRGKQPLVLVVQLAPDRSALSPTPFLSTNSRAIADSMSSSSSMLCKPSPANLPSIVSATSNFFPINRKHDACIVPS